MYHIVNHEIMCPYTYVTAVPFYNLQIIHSCVVDTAIVFPHRMGLPYKRALRNITTEFLDKTIQGKKSYHLYILLHVHICLYYIIMYVAIASYVAMQVNN